MKPKYAHECDRCIYLGTVSAPNPYHLGRPYTWDLYHCPSTYPALREGSVIARASSEGSDYMSSDVAILRSTMVRGGQQHPALHWALQLVEGRERWEKAYAECVAEGGHWKDNQGQCHRCGFDMGGEYCSHGLHVEAHCDWCEEEQM
jgi:hypothetical protein